MDNIRLVRHEYVSNVLATLIWTPLEVQGIDKACPESLKR